MEKKAIPQSGLFSTTSGMLLWGDKIGYVETPEDRSVATDFVEAWEIYDLIRGVGIKRVECVYRYRDRGIHRGWKQ